MTTANKPTYSLATKKILSALHAVENAFIVLVLFGMIGLAVMQIIMRNMADTSFLWIDPVLQNAVLWIAMLGAMIASRNDSHIRIDVLSEYVPPVARRFLILVVDLFTATITWGMAYFSYLTLMDERAFNTALVAGVEAWKLQILLPLGFAVIGLRYSFLLVLGLLNKRPAQGSQEVAS